MFCTNILQSIKSHFTLIPARSMLLMYSDSDLAVQGDSQYTNSVRKISVKFASSDIWGVLRLIFRQLF